MNASKSLSNISSDRDMWIAQYRQEMRERDERSRVSAAIEKAKLNTKRETAIVLKQANIAIDLIIKSTGLSPEEIAKL